MIKVFLGASSGSWVESDMAFIWQTFFSHPGFVLSCWNLGQSCAGSLKGKQTPGRGGSVGDRGDILTLHLHGCSVMCCFCMSKMQLSCTNQVRVLLKSEIFCLKTGPKNKNLTTILEGWQDSIVFTVEKCVGISSETFDNNKMKGVSF